MVKGAIINVLAHLTMLTTDLLPELAGLTHQDLSPVLLIIKAFFDDLISPIDALPPAAKLSVPDQIRA